MQPGRGLDKHFARGSSSDCFVDLSEVAELPTGPGNLKELLDYVRLPLPIVNHDFDDSMCEF